MSLNYEMARYTELTGQDGTKVSISRLGGYLDGYEKGRADAIDELLNNVSESIIWDILTEVMKRNIVPNAAADKVIDYLQEVAEQLKEKNNAID